MKRLTVLIIDIIIVYTAIWLSFTTLNHFGQLDNYQQNIEAFFNIAPYITPIYLILAYVFGMMNLQRKSITENLYTILLVTIGLNVSIMALIYLARESAVAYPRSVILMSPILYYSGLVLWRIFVQKLYIRSHGRRNVMIIGQEHQELQNVLNSKFSSFYNISHQVEDWTDDIYPLLKNMDDVFITEDISLQKRSEILIINNDYPQLNVYILPRISDISLINSKLNPFGDLPIHTVGKLYLKSEEKIVKRIIDIFVSILLLIITSPIFLITALLIKIDGGPIFFIQERLTRSRKVFSIYKFRSMSVDAEKLTGPTLSFQNDNRITTIGQLIRATRIDELPQLWNILKGDMSLVGPRPERPIFAEEIEKDLPEFKYRLNVKAGLTGFAQITGKYNTDFKQKLHYDLYYINNFSIFKDFLIMLQTIKVIFWKENTEGVVHNTSQQLKEKKSKL